MKKIQPKPKKFSSRFPSFPGPDFKPQKWWFWTRNRYIYVDTLPIKTPGQTFYSERLELKISEVQVGDILVCVGKPGFITRRIQRATNGPFTHAAIVGPNKMAHEARIGGVRPRSIEDLVQNYVYVVVLSHHLLSRTKNQNQLIFFLVEQDWKYSIHNAFRSGKDGGLLPQAPNFNKRPTFLNSKNKALICSSYVRLALHACRVWGWDETGPITTPNDIANTPDFAVRGLLSTSWPIIPHPQDSTITLHDVRNWKK